MQYSIQNNTLYRDKVKICENVEEGKFTADKDKGIVRLDIKIGEYKKTSTYVIENNSKTNNNSAEVI